MEIKNKKGTVIGFGCSGVAISKLILQLEGRVKVSDLGSEEFINKTLERSGLKGSVEFESGRHTESFFKDSDFFVVSPGVRFDAPIIQWAKNKNIPIFGEVEFAWNFCKNPIIAITGSNGKTTVSTLIADILTQGGKKTCLCGNIGSPFSQHVLGLEEGVIVVLEVSSFQLESVNKFCPDVAVFLNCTQNHLDRHKDMDDYFQAKSRIFLNQKEKDCAIFNFKDSRMQSIIPKIKSKVLYFNDSKSEDEHPAENPNFLAARCVGKVFGISDEVINKVFENFKGVSHRMELVRSINDIDFINDSKATTAEAGRWALERVNKPVLMICGGRDKHIDFSVLQDVIKNKVKEMIVIGEAKEKIKSVFRDLIPVNEQASLRDAVFYARSRAKKGDCVLLSPMCTSFDMFLNFEERGDAFKSIVNDL